MEGVCLWRAQAWAPPARRKGVGSYGPRGRQGRVRQAQLCWWGAWAPWGCRPMRGWGEGEPWPPELLASGRGRAGGGVQVPGMFEAEGAVVSARVLTSPGLQGLPQPGAWWETGTQPPWQRGLRQAWPEGSRATGARRPSGAGTAWTEAGTTHFLTPEALARSTKALGRPSGVSFNPQTPSAALRNLDEFSGFSGRIRNRWALGGPHCLSEWETRSQGRRLQDAGQTLTMLEAFSLAGWE